MKKIVIDKKTKYPTKDEIISCRITPTKNDIKITRIWKKTMWKIPKNIEEKIKTIKILLILLSKTHNKKTTIKYNPEIQSAYYSKKYDLIVLNNHSIITALHELGHTLHGNSELKACSWSIKLFQASFPIAFKKLKWENHKLIK